MCPVTWIILMSASVIIIVVQPQQLNFRMRVTDYSVQIDLGNNINIYWNPPLNSTVVVSGYTVAAQEISYGNCRNISGSQTTVVNLPGTARSYRFSSLTSWRMYQFDLFAYNVNETGPTESREVATNDIVPSGPPTDLTLIDVQDNSAELSWNLPVCQSRGGFLKYFTYQVTSTQGNAYYNTTVINAVLTLNPYIDYSFRVQFGNSVGAGPFTGVLGFKTKQGVPDPPNTIRLVSQTDVTLVITWDTPMNKNGILLAYRIYYSKVDSRVINQQNQSSSGELRATLSNLEPFTRYSVMIQAQTGSSTNNGWGAKSSPVYFNTTDGVPNAPSTLRLVYKNSTCIVIWWDPPLQSNGVLQAYRVSWYALSTVPTMLGNVSVNVLTKQLYICGLSPASKYQFEIAARTRNNIWGPVITSSFWTKIGASYIPADPVVISTNVTEITAQFQPVVDVKGLILEYFVVVGDIHGQRRKRQGDDDPLQTLQLHGYIAAQFKVSEMLTSLIFTIGDNGTHGGYENPPLHPNTTYRISFVVATSLDGEIEYSFSQATSQTDVNVTVLITTHSPETTTDNDTSTLSTEFPTAEISTEHIETTSANVVVSAVSSSQRVVAIIVPVVICSVVALVIIVVIVIVCMKRGLCCARADDRASLGSDDPILQRTIEIDPDHSLWSNTCSPNEDRSPVVFKSLPSTVDAPESVFCTFHSKSFVSIEDEYNGLPSGKLSPIHEAERAVNASKNRFPHILPYDSTRVVLRNSENGDYINASYIPDNFNDRAFIAAQGPYDQATICDFWKMIMQEAVSKIVLVSPLTKDAFTKCSVYWPTVGSIQHGHVLVRAVQVRHFADFSILSIQLSQDNGLERSVKLFQFLKWPESGVPDSCIPFIEFHSKVFSSSVATANHEPPVVVHCGTGISQTAVFIAVHNALQKYQTNSKVSIFNICKSLRGSRMGMVRTCKQYAFIYDTVFEATLPGSAGVVGDRFLSVYRHLVRADRTGGNLMKDHFHMLDIYTKPVHPGRCAVALAPENMTKNRFPGILPPDEARVVLKSGGENRDYINGIFIDSYFNQKSFIVTHTPMENSLTDFFRTLNDYKVRLIVFMNGPDFREESCVQYWPQANRALNSGEFVMELVREDEQDAFIKRTLTLTNHDAPQECLEICQLQFLSWKMYEKVPNNQIHFLQLVDAVESIRSSQGDHPVLVHCMDGASQSGLLVTCAVLFEKIRDQDSVDVFHTVKYLKEKRPQFLPYWEQYKFCYKVLWDYMNIYLHTATATETSQPNDTYFEIKSFFSS